MNEHVETLPTVDVPALNRMSLWAVALTCLVMLHGCMLAPHPDLPQETLPPLDQSALGAAGGIDPRSWWIQFHDPVLNHLVDEALRNNLSLAEARQRLQQSRRELGSADLRYLPELHFQTQNVTSASGIDTFVQFGFDSTWELDIFGRKDSTLQLARGTQLSQISRQQAAEVSVIGDVVRGYLELRTAEQQLQVLDHLAKLDQHWLSQLQRQQSLGLVTTQAIHQAAEQNAHAQLSRSVWDTQKMQSAWRLALLIGKLQPDPAWLITPTVAVQSELPLPPLPLSLLRSRPEIRQAEANIMQTAGELGLAKADLYPSLTLGFGYFFSSNETRNVTFYGELNSAPTFGPVIDIPLFDWGRRKRHEEAMKAALQADLLAYRQSVRSAYVEVQSDLIALQGRSDILKQQQSLLQGTSQSLQDETRKLALGLSSPLQLMRIQHDQDEQQLQLAEARTRYDIAYIALFKSLGGAALPQETRS
ncbi:MAG: TolC family protein [Pseudomonadales bacterium]|nr:TolC family protein [Pseudomonadales bacterium]